MNSGLRLSSRLLLVIPCALGSLYACGGDDSGSTGNGGQAGAANAGRAGSHTSSGGAAGRGGAQGVAGSSAGRGGGHATGGAGGTVGAEGGVAGESGAGTGGTGTSGAGTGGTGTSGTGAGGEAGDLGSSGAGAGGEAGARPAVEICGDGHDNDGDGLADCADPDCGAEPSCVLGCRPPAPYAALSTSAAGISGDSLVLWLRADIGVGTDDSARACVWEDQSGRAHHVEQPTAGARPATGGTLGTRAALTFTVDTNLARGDVLGIGAASGRTFFAAFQRTDATTRGSIVQQGASGTPGTYLGIDTNTFNTVGQRFGCYLTNNAYDADLATDLDPHVHTLLFDALTPGAAVLDVMHYRVDASLRALTRTSGGLGNGNVEDFSGANFTNIGNSNLALAEVIAYGRTLDGTEIAAVESYLLDRYGLAAH